MKNIIVIIFLLNAILFSQAAIAQNWIFQPQKSQLEWTGKAAFSAYTLGGTIQIASADIAFSDGQIQSGKFIFDMKSMDGEIEDLIQHLKSKDFFEVKKYKTATFKLEKMEVDVKGQTIARGQLTIKDKTKPIEILVDIQNIDNQLSIKGTAIVNRTNFGITFNSPTFFEKMKEQAIADNFELDFKLLFLKK